jgi:hypothetical protein
VDQKLDPVLFREAVAKLDHFAELPRRIDVQERKRRLARPESLAGQVRHHRRVLADRVEHDRVIELGGDFANDVNALGLELPEVREGRECESGCCCGRHNSLFFRSD